MFGQNPKRPPVTGDGKELEVQEIFYTLQGEGLYTGWPAIFIRLGGCNLACDFCDTEFESYSRMSLEAIKEHVETLSSPLNPLPLIVITGGEPFRQPLLPLCDTLLAKGYRIQIETNGTLFQPLPATVDIVCSPKKSVHSSKKYAAIRPDLLAHISAFKFIVSAHHAGYQQVDEVGQSQYQIPVYVQPMDEQDAKKNADNLAYATKLALEQGYRLSLQTHKIVGIS